MRCQPVISLLPWSRHLRLPVPLAAQVLHPAAAVEGEVLAMGDQGLMPMAGEQRDAVGPRVVAEEMAGHADLVAAAGVEQLLIEPRPGRNRLHRGGLQPGDVDRHHGVFCGPTPLAEAWRFCRLRPMLDKVQALQRGGSLLPELLAVGIPLAQLGLAGAGTLG